jgi:hypothetical protein
MAWMGKNKENDDGEKIRRLKLERELSTYLFCKPCVWTSKSSSDRAGYPSAPDWRRTFDTNCDWMRVCKHPRFKRARFASNDMLIFQLLFWHMRTLDPAKAKFAADQTSLPISTRRHRFTVTSTGLSDDYVYSTSEGEEVRTPRGGAC